jgi:hypothetical protein
MASIHATTTPILSHSEKVLLHTYRQLSSEERKLFLAAATCHDPQQRRAYMQQLSPEALDTIIRTLKPQD